MTCKYCGDTGSLLRDGFLDCYACGMAAERAALDRHIKEKGPQSLGDVILSAYQLGKERSNNALIKALENISRPANTGCGCDSPCRCECLEAEVINAEGMRDIAIAALAAAGVKVA